jgi:uncharacterized protein YbaR (Trm112 family)
MDFHSAGTHEFESGVPMIIGKLIVASDLLCPQCGRHLQYLQRDRIVTLDVTAACTTCHRAFAIRQPHVEAVEIPYSQEDVQAMFAAQESGEWR